jgi:acetylornithine deacetylase/succinyl-diaminopimelate desuccinylase-like protein
MKTLKQLGAENIELTDNGKQELPDGSSIPLPPIIFANLGSDPKKKTVLIYGHLDVQPANLVNETYFNFFNSSFSSI